MLALPRLAVGKVQANADLHTALWALMESLRQDGLQIQSFLSRACFSKYHGAAGFTGANPRHLDSWLMSPELCREIFVRGTEACDLAIVEGRFNPSTLDGHEPGGSLDVLCKWLSLPKVAVLDASILDQADLDSLPEDLDGLILDRVADERTANELESKLGVPVLGTLGEVAELREQIAAIPKGVRPARDICQLLGQEFSRRKKRNRILDIASKEKFDDVSCGEFAKLGGRDDDLVVALAYDEAFNCYFSDTLDSLEARGATVFDFSPLRDDRLPEDVDLVYIGCGRPERYADELTHNHCMIHSLREHLRTGGRIYAEGGGLVYLCQELQTPEGERKRMAGIFPALAKCNERPENVEPVEATLSRPTWLGEPGTTVRGYRNPMWKLEPLGYLTGCLEGQDLQYDLVGNFGALGSLLHLDFSAQPTLFPCLFEPHCTQSDTSDPWAVIT